MDRYRPETHPAELDALATELSELHAPATPDELERARSRAWARSRPAESAPTARRRLASARVALVAILAGAFLMTSSGATLALSGISSSGSAGTAQYPPPQQGILPEQESGSPPELTLDPSDESGELPNTAGGGVPADDPVDVERQVASGGGDGGELPFTGLAALPVLLLGCVVMVAGLALRRSSSSASRAP